MDQRETIAATRREKYSYLYPATVKQCMAHPYLQDHIPGPCVSQTIINVLSWQSLGKQTIPPLCPNLQRHRVLLCWSGWNVVVRSELTAASASWAETIHLPQPSNSKDYGQVPPDGVYIAQAGLELLTTSDPVFLASQSAEITLASQSAGITAPDFSRPGRETDAELGCRGLEAAGRGAGPARPPATSGPELCRLLTARPSSSLNIRASISPSVQRAHAIPGKLSRNETNSAARRHFLALLSAARPPQPPGEDDPAPKRAAPADTSQRPRPGPALGRPLTGRHGDLDRARRRTEAQRGRARCADGTMTAVAGLRRPGRGEGRRAEGADADPAVTQPSGRQIPPPARSPPGDATDDPRP
ncbi:hypothetical protein AAY473_030959 [Plecturocebus cupreus]